MSEKIYALLLRLYPSHFRRAYGDAALQLFRDRARDEKGFFPSLRLWLDLLGDLAVSVPREHRYTCTAVAGSTQQCWDGTPSFHVLEGEAPSLGSLLYGGLLSLVIYGFALFLLNHEGSRFPLANVSALQRPSYAIPPASAPPPDESTQSSDDDQAASEESNSPPGSPRPSGAFKPNAPGTMGSFGPPQSNPGHAQTAVATKKQFQEFDVASVRENKSNDPIYMNFPLGPSDVYIRNGGYIHVTNLSLFGYIGFAYKLNGTQLAALQKQLPDWVKSTKYDIEARVEGDPGKDDMRTMMRSLLAERFKLKIHTETREVAVLDLVLAKPGKTGPTLKAHPSGDALCSQGAPTGFVGPCGAIMVAPISEPGGMKMAGRNIPLTLFAGSIPGMAGKPVIDKTGLTGDYDFTLEFVPDSSPGSNITPEETRSTFLEAITDQMGLKLVPDKGPVEIYVFDQIERPSEN